MDSPEANSTEPLANKNYRVRRLLVVLEVDVYDDDGLLLNRGKSDEVVIPEAHFPTVLIELLGSMTGLSKGFVKRPLPSDTP